MEIAGTWALESWNRFDANGTSSQPLGDRPNGVLIYAPDGGMAVMMAAAPILSYPHPSVALARPVLASFFT